MGTTTLVYSIRDVEIEPLIGVGRYVWLLLFKSIAAATDLIDVTI